MTTRILPLIAMTLVVGCSGDDGIEELEELSWISLESVPLGPPVTAVIGPGGGSMESADGRLSLVIPPGALGADTEIGIQPISNNAPLGLGTAYRLTPESVEFQQPVTLTVAYDEALLGTTPPAFLWLLSRSEGGGLRPVEDSNVDIAASTVSAHTTHFSDWMVGRFIDLTLAPSAATLRPGQRLTLQVTGFDASMDELVPLAATGSETLLRHSSRFQSFGLSDVGDWQLNGVYASVSNSNGSLTDYGWRANYIAPGTPPDPNVVAVSVTMSALEDGIPATYTLISSIAIQDEYFLRVNGTDWIYPSAVGQELAHIIFAPVLDDGYVTVHGQNVVKPESGVELRMPAAGLGTFVLEQEHGNGELTLHPNGIDGPYHQSKYERYYEYDCGSGELCCGTETEYRNVSVNITTFGANREGRLVVGGTISGTLYDITADRDSSHGVCAPETPPPMSVTGEFFVAVCTQEELETSRCLIL